MQLPLSNEESVYRDHLGADEPTSGSLSSIDARRLFEGQLSEAATLAGRRILSNLREQRLPYAWSMTDLDLIIAAVNAYCTETNYTVPSPGQQAKPGVLLVEKKSSPLFFFHAISSGLQSRQLSIELGSDLWKKGVITVGAGLYTEYLDLLQEATRAFKGEPDKYLEDLSEIVAASAYTQILKFNTGPVGSFPSMVELAREGSGSLIFRATLLPYQPVNVPVSDRGSILIPWCGYNVFHELPKMLNSRFRFILTDSNPFVVRSLERAVSAIGADHISVMGGRADGWIQNDTHLCGIVFSFSGQVNTDDLYSLVKATQSLLIRDARILVHRPLASDRHNYSAGDEVDQMFKEAGFKLLQGVTRQMDVATPQFQKAPLELSGAEIASRLLPSRPLGIDTASFEARFTVFRKV